MLCGTRAHVFRFPPHQVDAKYKELCHKIALDTAKWSSYLAASRTDEVKRHQNAVFHAEAQRSVGHMVVDRYMDKYTKFFGNKDAEQVTQVFQMFKKAIMADFRVNKTDVYTVVLVDFTKFGVVSQDMIDWTVGIAGKALEADPNGVLLCVAPVLENSTVENGEAGERARIEKKLRAKDFWPVLISLIAPGPCFPPDSPKVT